MTIKATDNSPYTVGGTVQAGDGLYISRQADKELLDLCRAATFAYVLSPRQLGKSSLMVRTVEQLAQEDILSVVVDLTQLGVKVTPEAWYLGLMTTIEDHLMLDMDVIKWFEEHSHLGLAQRLILFFENLVNVQLSQPLVIFVDEIDTTLSLDFTDDFYVAIRSLYVARSRMPALKRLSFVLIGVATPGDLVRDARRTPFNIGHRVEMTDFSFEEALPLAEGLNLPGDEREQVLRWVLKWTGGHPYLTQRLCRIIAEQPPRNWSEAEVDRLVAQTFLGEKSEEDNNLQFIRDMLTKRAPDLEGVLTTYREVWLDKRPQPDEEQSLIKSHLKLAGVVKREHDVLKVRNLIYRTAFDGKWVKEHLPVNWAGRLHQARRLIFISFAVSIVMLGLAVYALVQQQQADKRTAEALEARNQSENQRKVAQTQVLAFEAQSAFDPEKGLLLSIEAASQIQDLKADRADIVKAQVEKVLRQSLQNSHIQATLSGHTAPVHNAQFSPDGKLVVSASEDKTARIWSVADSKELMVLKGHTGTVNSAAFSPDQKLVVTASDDNTVRLWEVATGKEVMTLKGHSAKVNSALFSPDGKLILTASSDGTARLWDAATGQQVRALYGHTDKVNNAQFNSDGKLIATASEDKSVGIWDSATGNQLNLIKVHSFGVNTASFSPDSKLVITASKDWTSRIVDIATGKEISNFRQHSNSVNSAYFSNTGLAVTSSDDGTAWVWDPSSMPGKSLNPLRGHTAEVNYAAFSPDGRFVVTSGKDNTVRVWDANGGGTLLKGHTLTVRFASFSPDGKLVATASKDTLAKIWEVSSGKELITLKGHADNISTIRFSPDGKRVVTASNDGTARVWDVTSGQQLLTLKHDDWITNAVFSPDGKLILTVGGLTYTSERLGDSKDGTLRVWDATTGQQLAQLKSTRGQLYNASFSPDSRLIVGSGGLEPDPTTGAFTNVTQVWNATTGQPVSVLRGHSAKIYSAYFSPDSKFVVTASDDKTARIWDAATGKELMALVGHSASVLSAVFSPDGKRVATASMDRSAGIWDVATGKRLANLIGHTSRVRTVEFSPDNTRLVTISSDNTAGIWDVSDNSGKQLMSFKGWTTYANNVTFSPDGKLILTPNGDGTTLIQTCSLCLSYPDLLALARTKVTRQLTNTEKVQVGLASEDTTGAVGATGTPAATVPVATVPAQPPSPKPTTGVTP